jgi:hypothetical protein
VSDIRALTVRRPWAALIAAGLKQVENRTWSTPYRGLLLIHAGAGWDSDSQGWLDDILATLIPDGFWETTAQPQGIVAVAELTGVCPGYPCECGPWAMAGNRHWQLGDVRALSEPVPAKGALGLWRPDADALSAVYEQIGVPR